MPVPTSTELVAAATAPSVTQHSRAASPSSGIQTRLHPSPSAATAAFTTCSTGPSGITMQANSTTASTIGRWRQGGRGRVPSRR